MTRPNSDYAAFAEELTQKMLSGDDKLRANFMDFFERYYELGDEFTTLLRTTLNLSTLTRDDATAIFEAMQDRFKRGAVAFFKATDGYSGPVIFHGFHNLQYAPTSIRTSDIQPEKSSGPARK